MDNMDPQLKQFYRQYMQQFTHPIIPAGDLLMQPDIQICLEDYFFDATNTNFAPQYQASILDRVIGRIERAVKNPDDDYVSNKLYETRAALAQAAKTDTLAKKKIAYFAPVPYDSPSIPPIMIEEAKDIIGSGPNVGLRTWEAALHLAYYLYQRPSLVANKAILELGAGTGFLSLFCTSVLGAESVLATDGNADVLAGLERNIALNPPTPGSPSPTAQLLEWSDTESLLTLQVNPPNLILGADINYHPVACAALATALSTLTRTNTATEILISATDRDIDTLQDFLALCSDAAHGLAVHKIPFSAHQCPDLHEQRGLFHAVAMPTLIYVMWARSREGDDNDAKSRSRLGKYGITSNE